MPVADGGTEPIGNRIIEVTGEMRSASSCAIRGRASSPTCRPAALKKGAALVASGGGKTTPCGDLSRDRLNGLGPVPGIAGRSPSYLVRQLYDMQQGTRKGAWSPLMKPVVANLTQDDMLAIAAYVASLR